MRRPLAQLVAVSLLSLLLFNPPQNPEPLVITPSSTRVSSHTDWSGLQQALDAKALSDFYAWAASQPPPKSTTTVRKASGGGDVSYSGDVFWNLALCESGGDATTNTGNGFYGAFQFLPSTWHSLGYDGLPTDYGYETQREAAQKLQARSGWGQWPACARKLGLV